MAAQDKQLSPTEVSVWVSKAPILSPIHEKYGEGVTLRSIYDDFSGLSEDHTRIQVNGEWVEDWSVTAKAGDNVLVIQMPRDPVTVAYVAIAISVISAVAAFLLFEPPAGPGEQEKLNRIKGPRNEAKPYDPVPVTFGRRRINPAYAAEPYTEFRGSDEYLSMLLCAGQGPLNLSEVKIGDTPINQYSNVQWEYVDGFSSVGYSKLLEVWNRGVVQENVNSELQYNDPPIVRSSAPGASRVVIEMIWPQGLRSNSRHSSDAITVQYQDGTKWYAVAPKVVNAGQWFATQSVVYDTDRYYMVGDVLSADTGYKAQGVNIIDLSSYFVAEYEDNGRTMAIFDADALLAAGLRIGSLTAWAFTTNEFAKSFTFTPVDPVTLQRRTDAVQIRLQKAYPEYLGSGNRRRRSDWFSIRSETAYTQADFESSIGVSADNPNFKPAIIAIKIRATDQLNGVIDNLNCVIESVVPQNWATDWSAVDPLTEPMKLSRNPAELYRWAIQGNTNKIRSSDAKLDLETLIDWRDYCTAEGWEASEYVNYEETLRKVLGNIAFTGRADFSYRDGKFSVVQKVQQTVPKQIFTPKNSSGLKSRREFPPNYDGIKFKFQNADREDQVDEGTYYDPYKFANNDPTQPLPGVEVTGTFKTIEFWGVTDPVLAQRHARFAFFEQKLRRETYELDTDIEGLVAGRGDMVRIAHDVIDVGIGQGFITQDAAATTTFFMDEEKGAIVGVTYYFQVRQVDTGTVFSEFNAEYQGGGEWLASTSVTLSRGDLAVYGEQGRVSLDCVIIGVTNQEDYGVSLTLVNSAPEIFDEDAVALPTYITGLTPRMDYLAPLPPIVLTSQSEHAYTNQTLSVFVKADDSQSIAGGAVDWFTLEYRVSPETVDPDAVTEDDAVVWQKAGTIPSTENRFEIPVETGYGRRFEVRAKALNRNMTSDWSPVTEIIVSSSPAQNVDDFTVTEQINTPKTPDGAITTLVVDVDPPADPNYLYAVLDYRIPGQDQFFDGGKIGWKFAERGEIQVTANGTQYEIRVRSVNTFGVVGSAGVTKTVTTTNVLDPAYDDQAPDSVLPVPNVRGLELFEQGNDTEFTGRDAKFVWRRSTVGDYVELGSEGLRGASASRLDQYFRDYKVEVWAEGKIVRDEFVYDPIYTYTFEKNAEDYKREKGVVGAWRTFELRVYERGRNNQLSFRPAALEVSNTAPDQLQGLSIQPGYSVIEIAYSRPDDLDFAGVDIWVSETPGFDPDVVAPTATVSDNSYVAGGLTDGTNYYVRLRPFDLFGRTGANTSAEFAVATKTGQDLSGLSGWAYELDPVDEAFIDANLANDAVPSEKVINLTAAKITTGTLLATETITSEGVIRAVDDINTPTVQTGLGPANLTVGGVPVTALLWSFNAAGVTFAIDEGGNPYFRGSIEASGFSNDELTIDSAGNLTSTGTFTFGDVGGGEYVEFDGTNLTIQTPFLQFDSTSAVLGNEATGEYIKYEGGIFEVGPNATIGSNADRTVTVGSGGDFATLNAALEYLSRTIPAYISGGFTAEITLLSGFVLAEQIIVSGVDLSWVTITSEDSMVTFSGSAIGAGGIIEGKKPAFAAINGAKFPKVDLQASLSAAVTDSAFIVCSGDGASVIYAGGPSVTTGHVIENFDHAFFCNESAIITCNGSVNVGDCNGSPVLIESFGRIFVSGRLDADNLSGLISISENSDLHVGEDLLARFYSSVAVSVFSRSSVYVGNLMRVGGTLATPGGGARVSQASTIIVESSLTGNYANTSSAIEALDGATIYVGNTLEATNSSGNGVAVSGGSRLHVDFSVDCSNASGAGISVTGGSTATFDGETVDCTNSGNNAMAVDNSNVRITFIYDGSGASFDGINCTKGGIVSVGTINGTTNISTNTLTANGIIFN